MLTTQVNNRGFTLIELMIVIAIIGILAAVAIPNYISFRNKSYCTATLNDAIAISTVLANYFAVPGNLTATTLYVPAAGNERPNILFGNNGLPTANTLLLSASTTGASAIRVGSSYLITATEGAGQCPTKVISSDSHWIGGGGFAATYSITF